jgi:hypothetical protein
MFPMGTSEDQQVACSSNLCLNFKEAWANDRLGALGRGLWVCTRAGPDPRNASVLNG